MSSLTKDLVLLILQFLNEEKFKESLHMLEKESGHFLNIGYLEECVIKGDWDEVEKYLSGFMKVEDNRYSMKIYFEIRKQRYFEALESGDHAKAIEILHKDLKVFSSLNKDIFQEMTMLLTLENIRENEQLKNYADTKTARTLMLVELKKLIEANPLLRDKLQFPTLKTARLQTLINQSINWQHQLCKNPRPSPEVKTLFDDHTCGQPNGSGAPSPMTNIFVGSMPRVGGLPPMGIQGPFQPLRAPFTPSIANWINNPSSVPHLTVNAGPIGLHGPSSAVPMLKRPRTPLNNPALDNRAPDSENVLKRSRPIVPPNEVNNMAANLPVTNYGQSQPHPSNSFDDLPKTVIMKLNQGSTVKSMDFHPVQQFLLLVGTNIGDVTIWDVGSRERLVSRVFKVWNVDTCTVQLQASLVSENYYASVNRVIWSPNGALVGVAYSKNIVHLYSYHDNDDLRNKLEIDAHCGNVNDIAFSLRQKQLCVITGGEDKAVKVWDTVTGNILYTFEGHEAPVYSVCPHQKENIQFIFATAIDGKIKAWLYDNLGSRVDYDAPGRSRTAMAYSSDGTRLFSCGTNKEGDSYIVEWQDSEGVVKRTYHGLGKHSLGVVQFDTTKNRFLAAGDEFQIKFWDMDNANLLMATDAEGGLQVSPSIRFNRNGSLLAVSTSDDGVKVLANSDGVRMLRSIEGRAFGGSKLASSSVSQSGDRHGMTDVQQKVTEEAEKSKAWKLTELSEQSQLRTLRLPDNLLSVRIIRMIYTNSGKSILALTYNAVHKLWKWKTEQNVIENATTSVLPELWQPPSGILMTNDISDTNLEEAVPCFALSKNDSYVMSASGGMVTLFNMTTFKTITTCMPPPPAATCLAFHPRDNNIIAVGMDDSSVRIYNVRLDEELSKLEGHQNKVTGLSFSNSLDVLVSSGADAQLCVWSADGWEKQANIFLQIPAEHTPSPLAQTRVQFHQDEIHLLAVHETQLAVYEVPKLEYIKKWVPQESDGGITDATYSGDGQLIYASLKNGSVAVLTSSSLQMRCRISSSAYLPPNHSSGVYPVVVAAHPIEPNQFALGLSDGGVHVLEPPESEGKWGDAPPLENGTGFRVTSISRSDEQRK